MAKTTRSLPWRSTTVLFCIVLYVATIAAQSIVNTVELKVPIAGGQSCVSQNLDYYDSIQFVCKSCTGTGKVVDTSVVDPIGNYVQCKCATGYVKTPADCSKVFIEMGMFAWLLIV
jgi:hypothetical protein